MKILVVQLARLGDIFQSWPSLKALKRAYPTAEIDLLVRDRFSAATEGLSSVSRICRLDTKEILGPIITGKQNISESLVKWTDFLQDLRNQHYDKVINLSFSPLSSYLVDFVSHQKTEIKGYTRTSDGFLAIPDDVSAYFYAQVGENSHNRVHLTEIFASICGVELIPSDLKIENDTIENDRLESCSDHGLNNQINNGAEEALFDESGSECTLPTNSIVVHLGSSQPRKTLSAIKWQQIVRSLIEQLDCKVILIGSHEEQEKALQVKASLSSEHIVDLVGKTKIPQLFSILRHAQLVIGGDSMVMHMASLTNTPCVNISLPGVNFWETGPLAEKSRILLFQDESEIMSTEIANNITAILADKQCTGPHAIRASSKVPSYEAHGMEDDDFAWRLIGAIYMGEEFPLVTDELNYQALLHLRELCWLADEQFTLLGSAATQQTAVKILDQVDSLIEAVGQQVPQVLPLIRWFQTERTRIGPGPVEEIFLKTKNLFIKLRLILEIYLGQDDRLAEVRGEHGSGITVHQLGAE